jgi:hypothetical protein
MKRKINKTDLIKITIFLVLIFLTGAKQSTSFASNNSLENHDTNNGNKNLKKIDELLKKNKLQEAIEFSLKEFHINHTECRSFKIKSITEKTEENEQISAKTTFEQIVQLDPLGNSFKTANFLVSILIHESIHCKQHEEQYQLI